MKEAMDTGRPLQESNALHSIPLLFVLFCFQFIMCCYAVDLVDTAAVAGDMAPLLHLPCRLANEKEKNPQTGTITSTANCELGSHILALLTIMLPGGGGAGPCLLAG